MAARQGYDDIEKCLEAFPTFRHLWEQEVAPNHENQCPASKQLSELEVMNEGEEYESYSLGLSAEDKTRFCKFFAKFAVDGAEFQNNHIEFQTQTNEFVKGRYGTRKRLGS